MRKIQQAQFDICMLNVNFTMLKIILQPKKEFHRHTDEEKHSK